MNWASKNKLISAVCLKKIPVFLPRTIERAWKLRLKACQGKIDNYSGRAVIRIVGGYRDIKAELKQEPTSNHHGNTELEESDYSRRAGNGAV